MIGRTASIIVALLLCATAGFLTLLNAPQLLFGHHASLGRLSLYSDRPLDPAKARAILADVERRLQTSPIDDHRPHAIVVANSEWRRKLVFNVASGAAGVNLYPLTNNVFLRHSDIDHNEVFGASGKPAAPPRTLAYFAAHEITHAFTAERLGPGRLWNLPLPQWVREGYADYVGLDGEVDVDALYRAYRAGDPRMDYRRSGTYAPFRLLTAYFLIREHWSLDRLLACRMTLAEAEAAMNAGMAAPSR